MEVREEHIRGPGVRTWERAEHPDQVGDREVCPSLSHAADGCPPPSSSGLVSVVFAPLAAAGPAGAVALHR